MNKLFLFLLGTLFSGCVGFVVVVPFEVWLFFWIVVMVVAVVAFNRAKNYLKELFKK